MKTSESLLIGAFDIHIHAGPDIVPRKMDAVDLVSEARDVGMAGILIKDHVKPTSDRAYMLSRLFPDIQVFGALALNYTVGGINLHAVRAAVRSDVKQIYMPTFSAAHDIRQGGGVRESYRDLVPQNEDVGIKIVDNEGNFMRALNEILKTVAESDTILGTGHISPHESLGLIKRARALGVDKILVTHPMSHSVDMPLKDQKEAVSMGAIIEHCYFACTPLACSEPLEALRKMAAQIQAVGPGNCIMSTDLGQSQNISPVEGMKEFIEKMLSCGISEEQIDIMIRKNPKKILGL